MNETFSGKRAYEHVRKMAVEIGPRMMGTDGDRQGAEYVRECLSRLGLEVREQVFDVPSGAVKAHKVEVLEPALGAIAAYPVLLTPDTPMEGVTGELVYLEGSEAPQVGLHLEGKIVLGMMGGPDPIEGLRKVLRYKPLAMLAVASGPGVHPKQFHFTAQMVKPFSLVTMFMVSLEDAMRMVRAGASKVRLMFQSVQETRQSRNVIAELKGSRHPDEIVVIGGHMDTTPDLPGAQDNAAGTAIVLELARLYSDRGSKRTIRFAGWGGEEGGFIGSRFYVDDQVKRDKEARKAEGFVAKRDQTEWDQHRLAISADVAGMAVGWNVCSCLGPPEIATTMRVLAKELGVPHQVDEAYYGSDNLPFAAAGVPAIALHRAGPATAYMHGPEDAIDLIDPARLQEVGCYLDTFLQRAVAGAQAFPFERTVPDKQRKETQERLKAFGVAPDEEEAKQ